MRPVRRRLAHRLGVLTLAAPKPPARSRSKRRAGLVAHTSDIEPAFQGTRPARYARRFVDTPRLLVGRRWGGFGGVSWCDALLRARAVCVHASSALVEDVCPGQAGWRWVTRGGAVTPQASTMPCWTAVSGVVCTTVPARAGEGDGVDAAELDGDAPPGVAGASFGDADEQQGEPAEQHVGADAWFDAVVDGAQIEGGLEVPEPAFGFEEVLVAERDVLGGQVGVARWTAGTCRRVVPRRRPSRGRSRAGPLGSGAASGRVRRGRAARTRRGDARPRSLRRLAALARLGVAFAAWRGSARARLRSARARRRVAASRSASTGLWHTIHRLVGRRRRGGLP